MRTQTLLGVLPLLLTTLLAGCRDSTAPDEATLVLTRPHDMVVIVYRSSYESGPSPAGGFISQYALWIGSPYVTRAEAGVVVAAGTPVFIRENGRLTRASAAAIEAGDVIELWRDASVAYRAVQAPPGAPCYFGEQVVISRS